MPESFESLKREYSNTYFVQDRSNQEEIDRLQIQDQMVTADMGGVLPEQPDPTRFRHVLDVGCGTGGWLIEMAKSYPDIRLLVGIDASRKMIDYAREQAIAQGVNDRVEFHVMDALLILEFPHNYFDLVNQRFGWSWLRTWEWPKILQEYQRVCQPGGVVRVTEANALAESNSPAQQRLAQLALEVFSQSGHLFTPQGDGVTSQLARLFYQYGLQDVQAHTYVLQYRPDTPTWESGYENARHFFRTGLPFFRKWTRVPDDYEALCQQMLDEMRRPDFVSIWSLTTAWGTKNG